MLDIVKNLNEKSRTFSVQLQVLEDVSLPANTALPSYVISHGGLAGMRIRIPNGTTWSDALPLEHVEGEGTEQHLIVQVIMKLIYISKFEY